MAQSLAFISQTVRPGRSLIECTSNNHILVFPDRVGRVVLDGVVDPEIWANRPAHEVRSIYRCVRISSNLQ